MSKTTVRFFILSFLLVVLTGCETCKGFKKDIENTEDNIGKAGAAINRADAWMREHMW